MVVVGVVVVVVLGVVVGVVLVEVGEEVVLLLVEGILTIVLPSSLNQPCHPYVTQETHTDKG